MLQHICAFSIWKMINAESDHEQYKSEEKNDSEVWK